MAVLAVPAAVANLAARGLVGWLGGRLPAQGFPIAIGLVASALLVWIINIVARGSATIGGGPLSATSQLALIIAAACNAAMIYAVWHFGWKSTSD
jgi:hypothetical protein